jgi:hypothetical protein
MFQVSHLRRVQKRMYIFLWNVIYRIIEIWIRSQMLVKVSNIKYYKSVQWFYTWRIDTIELTASVAIFFSKHVKNWLFPIEKSVFAGSGAVTASETTVMDFRIPLTALAVSLFPSLSYFMTYFKCVITYLIFWFRWTSSEQQLNIRRRSIQLRSLWLTTTVLYRNTWFLTLLLMWEVLNWNLRPFKSCCT